MEAVNGNLKIKTKAPTRGWAAKQGAGTSAPNQSSPKRLHLVDEKEFWNSPTRKLVVTDTSGMPDTTVEITHCRDRLDWDDSFLGWD